MSKGITLVTIRNLRAQLKEIHDAATVSLEFLIDLEKALEADADGE